MGEWMFLSCEEASVDVCELFGEQSERFAGPPAWTRTSAPLLSGMKVCCLA